MNTSFPRLLHILEWDCTEHQDPWAAYTCSVTLVVFDEGGGCALCQRNNKRHSASSSNSLHVIILHTNVTKIKALSLNIFFEIHFSKMNLHKEVGRGGLHSAHGGCTCEHNCRSHAVLFLLYIVFCLLFTDLKVSLNVQWGYLFEPLSGPCFLVFSLLFFLFFRHLNHLSGKTNYLSFVIFFG